MPKLGPDPTTKLREIQNLFQLSEEKAKEIGEKLIRAFSDGCKESGKDVGMLPTYVTKLPDGTEEGEAWAIDLGGTNLRVCKVVLNGKDSKLGLEKNFTVSEELKRGTAAQLFDYIADCLYNSMDAKDLQDLQDPQSNTPSLGFTFSFPVLPTAINKGELIRWTKEYKIEDAINKDVAELLNDALKNRKLPIRCNALLNDTTGTLISHTYHTDSCSVGAIFGTGTNGALVGKVSEITKLHKPNDTGSMVVNTEWGGFDPRSVLSLTRFDEEVDKNSGNKESHIFEKLISGKYLGEITRYILLELIQRKLLLIGHASSKFDKPYGFDTRFMSDIEKASPEEMNKIREILTGNMEVKMEGENKIEDSDLEIVRWACQCVGIRAALLSGIAVAAAINFTNAPSPVSVGIDGTVFLEYPNFEDRLRQSLEVLVPDKQVKIGRAKGGSSIGAAICAFLAAKN